MYGFDWFIVTYNYTSNSKQTMYKKVRYKSKQKSATTVKKVN